MPRRRRRPHGRDRAALPGLIALLLAAGLGACGNGPAPEPDLTFSATASPLSAISSYGQVVPFRFTIRNDGDSDVEVARVDAFSGWRRELTRHLGLLAPGASVSFEVPYRVIDAQERLFLALRISATGRACEAGAVVPIPCPPAPFDPGFRETKKEGWTWCTALDGFVIRFSRAECQLRKKDDVVPLPPLPFGFLDDLDLRGAVRVRDERKVVTVTEKNLADFLQRVLTERRRIGESAAADGVEFELR